MNSILDKNLILKGKKVIVRVDLNVPMKDGVITEASRIIKILPTLKLLIKKEAKIIILSHTNVAADEIKDEILELPQMQGITKKSLEDNICTIHHYCKKKSTMKSMPSSSDARIACKMSKSGKMADLVAIKNAQNAMPLGSITDKHDRMHCR